MLGDDAAGVRVAPVQELLSPRERYVLMDLAYDATPRTTDLVAPLEPSAANPMKEPNLKSAKTHEIVFGGGTIGDLHQACQYGKQTDMRDLLRRGKAWAVKGHVFDSLFHIEHILSLVLASAMFSECVTILCATNPTICTDTRFGSCTVTGLQRRTNNGGTMLLCPPA